MTSSEALAVVIAGGGVAAVETALALRDAAGERVALTLVAPEPDFTLRALRTAEPFAADHVRRRPLRGLAERLGAELRIDTVAAVDDVRHVVELGSGATLDYDALVLATGARRRTAFARAVTFDGTEPVEAFGGLLADLEEGWSRSVAFVVPPGAGWTLPIYELALMTAAQARAMGADIRLTILTPERAPLGVFGTAASQAVARLLAERGIAFEGSVTATADADGAVRLQPGDRSVDAERIVALPIVEGRRITGVPADERGFIPVDDHGRVTGLDDVFAAGDGTTFPIKQGGVACQMADAVAEALAAHAGARVQPRPFRPILRGHLLTPDGAAVLEHPLRPGYGIGAAPALRLWSPAHKIEGRYLSAWLEEPGGQWSRPAA